jgi:chromosome partitioning protein
VANKLSVVNQKGGVAKTTTAVNLAAVAASRGQRVLLIDYDAQGNASQFLGFVERLDDPELYTSADFTLCRGDFATQPTAIPNLELLPANESLARIERQLLSNVASGARALGEAVRRIEHRYDLIIADCGPTLGMLTITAIAACPNVLIPIKLAPASVMGAFGLREVIDDVSERVESKARIIGTLGTFYKETGTMAREVLELVRSLFGPLAFKTVIHASDRVERAAGRGSPIASLEPSHRASVEYELLFDEIEARLGAGPEPVIPLTTHSTKETTHVG